MKKVLIITTTAGCAAALMKYISKNGLPVLGNLTMYLPFKTGIDPYDLMVRGIQFAESKNIVL